MPRPRPGEARTLRSRARRLISTLARPALAPIVARLDRLQTDQRRARRQAAKYRRELEYWRWLIRGGGSEKRHGGAYDQVSRIWRRNRLLRLGDALGLERSQPHAGIDRWCQSRTVIEIGAGPFPTVAAARLGWTRAVAVDPLARAYAEEGLLDPEAVGVTYVEAPGENIPLPAGQADLVICENCLDHVSRPALVMREVVRLLRPGGYLWLFVDLSEHRDAMHPHPMTQARIARLTAELEQIAVELTANKAHPKAHGALRGLYRKPAPAEAWPEPDAPPAAGPAQEVQAKRPTPGAAGVTSS
jgi:SAM-dependent methyltransferase